MPKVLTHRIFTYPLTVGLPHTNLNALAEPQLLMHAGHFQWTSIAQAIGTSLSLLKTPKGFPIYATYYYVEEDFPQSLLLNHFQLDQDLVFWNRVRHFKGVSIDGELIFNTAARLDQESIEAFGDHPDSFRRKHPFLRMCNVFISREERNDFLKIAAPEGCCFDALPVLPLDENAYPITREAARRQTFGMFGPKWALLDRRPDFQFEYTINPDRDTNGAGLVYFAHYIAFLEMAERAALAHNVTRAFSEKEIHFRTLQKRKIAYYGNVDLGETLQIFTSVFFHEADRRIGFRYRVRRKSDGKMIALSEAEKRTPHP